jgi:hypothetical protein
MNVFCLLWVEALNQMIMIHYYLNFANFQYKKNQSILSREDPYSIIKIIKLCDY